MFVISSITSFLPLLPSSLQHMFPCSSALFFPILRFSSPCHRVCFLNSSFWAPLPPLPPLPFSFSLLPPTCPKLSGLGPVTPPLHYITATYNTLISLRTPRGFPPSSIPIGGDKTLLSPIGQHSTWTREPHSEMIIFYNVTYLCWKWLHPMVFWGMRPPFGAGNRCIQWAYYTIGRAAASPWRWIQVWRRNDESGEGMSSRRNIGVNLRNGKIIQKYTRAHILPYFHPNYMLVQHLAFEL